MKYSTDPNILTFPQRPLDFPFLNTVTFALTSLIELLCFTIQGPDGLLGSVASPHMNLPTQPDIWIARSVGIIAIASGFILGMHGLDEPDSFWLPTALGLILTGLVAQGYALIRWITRTVQQDKKEP